MYIVCVCTCVYIYIYIYMLPCGVGFSRRLHLRSSVEIKEARELAKTLQICIPALTYKTKNKQTTRELADLYFSGEIHVANNTKSNNIEWEKDIADVYFSFSAEIKERRAREDIAECCFDVEMETPRSSITVIIIIIVSSSSSSSMIIVISTTITITIAITITTSSLSSRVSSKKHGQSGGTTCLTLLV